MICLWWRSVCSYYVSCLDRHVTYYTSHMCTYVYTRLSLPSLKYISSSLALNVFTSLHIWWPRVLLYMRPQPHNTLLAPTCTFFEYKTKHVERQRVLPAFAHALSCTRLQSTPRPKAKGKRRERPRGPARGPRGIPNYRLLAPRPDYVVSKNGEQIPNL